MTHWAKIELNRYFAGLIKNPSGVRTLADLIKFNDDHPDLEEPTNFTDQSEQVSSCYILPKTPSEDFVRLIESEATTGFNAAYFNALSIDRELGGSMGIDAALKEFDLDALVLPSQGFTTTIAGELQRLSPFPGTDMVPQLSLDTPL